MKVEPHCSPDMPALQLREEPGQTMKHHGTPPFPGGKVQSPEGESCGVGGIGEVGLLALSLPWPWPNS